MRLQLHLLLLLEQRCEIFTDVEGVFTADPRVVNSAELIPEITYEEMLEMASSGAGVLMARSVEFGRRYNVPIIVKSTFTNNKGTEVKEKVMEEALVSGGLIILKKLNLLFLKYQINPELQEQFLVHYPKSASM